MHWNQCKQSWNLWLTETTLQKNVLLVRITQSNTSKKKIQVKHGCFCFIFLYPLIIMTMSLYALNSLFLEILFSSRGSIGINVSCWTMCFFSFLTFFFFFFLKAQKRCCPAISLRGSRKISGPVWVGWDWWWTEPQATRTAVKGWGLPGKWSPAWFLSCIAALALWWLSY